MTTANQCPQCRVPLSFDGFAHACQRCGVRQPRINPDSRQCQRCGHSLHLAGTVMKCSKCGSPHPDHPISVKCREHAEAQKGKASTVPFIAAAKIEAPADPRAQALEAAIASLATPKKK